MPTINLKVVGMTCGGCAAAVEKALKSVEGVEQAEVDLQAGIAVVNINDAGVDPTQLVVAVKLAGYDAQLI